MPTVPPECSRICPAGGWKISFSDFSKQPEYRPVWDTYLKHLAVVINNLHMILDYDIVLGGYVGSFLTPWLDTIRHLVSERNTFEDDGSFVKLCTYQTGAAAYGAAMDVMEGFLRTV